MSVMKADLLLRDVVPGPRLGRILPGKSTPSNPHCEKENPSGKGRVVGNSFRRENKEIRQVVSRDHRQIQAWRLRLAFAYASGCFFSALDFIELEPQSQPVRSIDLPKRGSEPCFHVRDFLRHVVDISPSFFCGFDTLCKIDPRTFQSPLRHRLQLLQFSLFCIKMTGSAYCQSESRNSRGKTDVCA